MAAELGEQRPLGPSTNGSQGRDRGASAGSGEATKARRVAAPGLEQLPEPEPPDGPPPPPRHGRERLGHRDGAAQEGPHGRTGQV